MATPLVCRRCWGRGDVIDTDPELRALRMRMTCPGCKGTGRPETTNEEESHGPQGA